MRLSHRFFIVMENDKIMKIPNRTAEKLWNFDKNTFIPELINKKARAASFIIELVDRKPSRIIQENYNYYEFDKYGKLDKNKYFEQLRVHLNTVEFFPEEEKPITNIIDGTKAFYKKRLESQYQWLPTEEIKNELYRLIFKS